MNAVKYSGVFAVVMTLGGVVFNAGKHSEKINELVLKSNCAEAERKSIHDVIYDMHGRVCAIERDIQRLVKG